jgi:hypothetical protein
VFQNVRDAVAKPPKQEMARPVTQAVVTVRGQRNDGSRLDLSSAR